jgi:hypothetical protein
MSRASDTDEIREVPLSLRTKRSTKDLIERMARESDRSVAYVVERLILDEATRRGWLAAPKKHGK